MLKRVISSITIAALLAVCVPLSSQAGYKLAEPAIHSAYLDGEYSYHVAWSQVENADYYEVIYKTTHGKRTFECTYPSNGPLDTWFDVDDLEAILSSDPITLKIRSVSNKKGVTPSDYVTINYEAPSIDYSQINYLTASCLSPSQLYKWIRYCGGTPQNHIERINQVDYCVISFDLADDATSLGEKLLDAIGSIGGSALDGAIDGGRSAYDNDKDAIKKYADDNSDGIRDYVENYLDAAGSSVESGAKWGALFGALDGAIDYALTDRKMHFSYYYPEQRNSSAYNGAAVFAKANFLVKNRKNYKKELLSGIAYCDDDSQTYYDFSYLHNRLVELIDIDNDVKKNTKNPRWEISFAPVSLN